MIAFATRTFEPPGLEIRVNFGVFAGREATPAEIDELAVHLLDKVPGSETNIAHYVESSYFPDAFNSNTMDGPDVGPHSGRDVL